MAKRPLLEFILQVINLVFTVCGLGILVYGLLCFFKWKKDLSKEIHEDNTNYMIVHPFLLADPPSKHLSDSLPKAWFNLTIGIGATLLTLSCLGYVGTATRSPCCLLFYCMFLVALIVVELGAAVFIFLDHSWKDLIPEDTTGTYHIVYDFVNVNWKVNKWIALGVFVLQVIAMIVAIYLRSVFNTGSDDRRYDSRIAYIPRVRTYDYSMVSPTTSKNSPTATNRRGDEHIVHLPRVRTHDDRMVAPTASKNSPTATNRSGDEYTVHPPGVRTHDNRMYVPSLGNVSSTPTRSTTSANARDQTKATK